MLKSLVRWLSPGLHLRVDQLRSTLNNLEERAVDLRSAMFAKGATMSDLKITRTLYCEDAHGHGHIWTVTGTEEDIAGSAKRMSKHYGGRCVLELIRTGCHHTKGCDDRPEGGFEPEGN